MKKNYRDIVLKNVEDNYDTFKEAELAKSKIEIYEDAYKINFMENITDFLEYAEFSDKIYAFLARDKDRVLDEFYNHYMRDWDRSVANPDEIEDFIRDYYDAYAGRGSEM